VLSLTTKEGARDSFFVKLKASLPLPRSQPRRPDSDEGEPSCWCQLKPLQGKAIGDCFKFAGTEFGRGFRLPTRQGVRLAYLKNFPSPHGRPNFMSLKVDFAPTAASTGASTDQSVVPGDWLR
jgi:hypothetical protein